MKVTVIDELPAELSAMVQANYSRSHKSIEERLKETKDPAKFLKKNYIGYGHKSIGDCGTTTIYIENVSFIVAKAIQDSPLYNGQETSSRYIDFSEQGMHFESEEQQAYMERMIKFYEKGCDLVFKHLRKTEDESKTDKAIKALTFDIMRGFLPAGMHTQLAWTTTLSHAQDHLQKLYSHPIAEVRMVASIIHDELSGKYPSSFKPLHTQAYTARSQPQINLKRLEGRSEVSTELRLIPIIEDMEELTDIISPLFTRKKYDRADRYTDFVLQARATTAIAYADFRDIQRHRNGYVTSNLPTIECGIESWYVDSLPESLQDEAIQLLDNASTIDGHHHIPMAYAVPVEQIMGISQLIYFIELRSGETVHPVVRRYINDLFITLKELIPGIEVFPTPYEDALVASNRRGDQDIVNLEETESGN